MFSAGGSVKGQNDDRKRFAAITYDTSSSQFVFYARRLSDGVSSYICQLQQGLVNYDNIVDNFT